MSYLLPIESFGRGEVFRRSGTDKLNEMADLSQKFRELYPFILELLQRPINEPIPPFFALGKITAVQVSSPTVVTYDAESYAGIQISVSGATPMLRLLDGIEITPAAVNDPVLMFYGPPPTGGGPPEKKIVVLTEKYPLDDCPAPLAAMLDGGGDGMFHDGYTLKDAVEYLYANADLISGVTPIKTSGYAAAINELVRCNPTGGAFAVTLPTAIGNERRSIVVKNVSSSTNTITVDTTGGQTIDGSATDTIVYGYGSRQYTSDGSNWVISRSHFPPSIAVPTSRTINTTAPLTGGGNLSADLTLAVSTFGAGASGVVPASGGGTSNFMRADGTWAAPASSVNIKQTEIDFGSTPVSEASFTITDADVSAGSQLLATVAYEAPTDKDLDELEMDQLDLKIAPGSGEFTLYVTGLSGYVADKFKINYLIG